MGKARWVLFLLVLGLSSCGDQDEPEPPANTSLAASLGLDRYLGGAEASVESSEGDTTVFAFDPAQGPMCMRGDTYRASIRDTPSEDLLIFLQGGGACWSDFCLTVTSASSKIPPVDILDPELELNPTRGWDVVYLPYCDGSFFSGDRDHDEDGDGTPDRMHRGLQNLSAALSLAKERFPTPRRVVLAGSSGGAYGTLFGAILVRHLYPDTPLIVMADSGVGLGRPGDAPFVAKILDEFGLADAFPKDCADCLVEGHMTALFGWFLDHDPEVRVGIFSSWYDGVLSRLFLQTTPEAFRDALATETDRIAKAHPERFRRFIVDGSAHTALLGDASGVIGADLSAVEIPPEALSDLSIFKIGGLEETAIGEHTFADWLEAMIEGDDDWVDRLEEPGPPPEMR